MKKDPGLASLELEIELDTGSFLDISLVPEGPFYTLEIKDRGTGRVLDVEVFTENPVPDIYNTEDLNQALAIIFDDVKDFDDKIIVTKDSEIAEWAEGKSFEELASSDQITDYHRGVDYVINDLAETALYNSIGRSGNSLYCQYENIVIEVNFKLLERER